MCHTRFILTIRSGTIILIILIISIILNILHFTLSTDDVDCNGIIFYPFFLFKIDGKFLFLLIVQAVELIELFNFKNKTQ